jgi:hypothetical protein
MQQRLNLEIDECRDLNRACDLVHVLRAIGCSDLKVLIAFTTQTLEVTVDSPIFLQEWPENILGEAWRFEAQIFSR